MRKNADLVSHHAHPVERRLTIEEYIIPVHQVTVDNVALKELKVLARNVLEGNHAIVSSTNNRLSTRIDIRAILNQLVEFVNVK